jgi:hypothetical protein
MKKIILLSLFAVVAAGIASTAPAASEAEVDASFNPYKNGMPTFPGLTAGMVIGRANVDQFKDVLDPANYQLIKDGWYEITVGASFDFPNPPSYIEATRKGAAAVKLGAKPGAISGFTAGRPFPEEPKLSDPRAGEKLAWNFKYGLNWGDGAMIGPMYWRYINALTGQVERTVVFEFHFLNFKHRIVNAPLPEITPNPSNLFRATYLNTLAPLELKNTQLLIQRYEDDMKLDDAFLYLGFQRRVRRLATGQTTDSFLGSDLMIEDFEGYNGRISDMKWTFLGTKNALMPYYKHNEMKLSEENKQPDGFKFVAFGGKGNCTPQVTWQLRKVYVLQAEPVNPAHPISKRVMYLDAQVFGASRSMVFDRKGDLWKSFTIGKAHPDFHLPINKGSGIALDDAASMIDVQSKHCTSVQFKGQIDPAKNPPSLFQVQNLRGGD